MIMPVGSADATIIIVADSVDFQDLSNNKPLTGAKGYELSRMLNEAGINRSQVFETAFIRDRHKSADQLVRLAKNQHQFGDVELFDKSIDPEFLRYRDLLLKEISLVKPKVVVVLGNGALFALTGKWGLKSWRGSSLQIAGSDLDCVVIPTYSPDYILAVWKERQIAVSDLRRCKAQSEAPQGRKPLDYNFLVRPSFPTVTRTLDMLLSLVERGVTKLSVDIETRGGHTACTGIAWSMIDAICIPHLVSGNNNYWTEHEEAFIVHKLYRLLTHPNAQIVGQNFLYDAQYFYRHFHFIPRLVRDTMIAEHSMFSNMPKGLDYLSSKYCNEHVYWKGESKDWDPKIGEEQLWIYNCKDCCITYEVDDVQQEAIDKFVTSSWPQLRAVHDFQQSLFYPVLETMVRGLRTDNERKSALADELRVHIDHKQNEVNELVGFDLNPRSPKQMQDLFYRQLAQKPVKDRQRGTITTNDKALDTIASREPLLLPLCRKIQELRSLSVFVGTFLDAPVDVDQRMRCSFNIAGTETYRFSSSQNAFSSGMNLQNIPKGDEESDLPNVRSLFIPDEGYEFFDIDLDSADLRIVVWESDCKEMKSMFAEGLKPYVEVAKEYYHDPSIDKHHPSYKLFKALCHGTNYLGTPGGLAGRIGLLASEVERIQKWYYGKFPEILLWQEQIKRDVSSRKYIENVFGYREYFFDRIEGTIFNQAVAWIPQSTVACLINRGYNNLFETQKEIQVLLQVHDSLAGQYPRSMGDTALRTITDCCSVPLPYAEPLIIPVGIKSSTESWGHCG